LNLASLVQPHPSDARAFHSGGRWHTWGEVRAHSASVAGGLARAGISPGDRVAIAWPNSVDFVVAYLAVLAAGAVAVPLNPNSPLAELVQEIGAVQASALFFGGPAAAGPSASAVVAPLAEVSPGAAASAGTDVPSLLRALHDTLIVLPEKATAPSDPAPRWHRVAVWEELSSTGPEGSSAGPPEGGATELPVVERSESDLAALLFTSGTAGAPRAAMLTHLNLLSNLRQVLALPEVFSSDDVGLAAVPLFHVFGLNVALGLVLATGAALVLEERFDPGESLDLVRELGVTTLVGVPTMFSAWAGVDPGSPDSAPIERSASVLAGIRRAISGAAALPPDVTQSFERRYGIPLWQGYGLTEASPAVSTTVGTGRHRPGSVGRPIPGVELRLVDDAGEQVLRGDPGEIWVRGPNVFAGYWRDEAATSQALSDDGWLRTGDIGILGDDGDLYVVDRKKDLVIVSGFNVFPAEVEQVIEELPGVAAAVVVGRPDPVTGEAVEAFVVPTQSGSVTEDEVRVQCVGKLARYKCPSTVRFVPDLPTGLSGKALRRALREQDDAQAS
jgi:long-chain acyl-CoA synthetase